MRVLAKIVIASVVGVFPAYSEGYREVCLSTSDQVLRQYPNSHAFYTYRMKGHEGERCWHPGTKFSTKKAVNPVPLKAPVHQDAPIPQAQMPDSNLCDFLCQIEFQKFLEWQNKRGGF